MNYTKKLEEHFLESINKSYRFLQQKDMPKRAVKQMLQNYNDKLNDPNVYKSFSIRNDKVDKFIIAFKEDCPFEGKIIKCWRFSFFKKNLSKDIMLEELNSMFKFFKTKKRPIKVAYDADEKTCINNLITLGFNLDAYKLIGNINDSLKYIKSKQLELEDGYRVHIPKKSHIKKMMILEVDIHKHESTSVASYNKKSIDIMSSFMSEMIDNKALFAIVDSGDNCVGHIGIMFNQGIGHIATIAVSRNYQGQGISYLLYEKALCELKRRGIERYTGFTATHKVLDQARKLKRTPYVFAYKFPSC